jgi:hypothetical protein
MNRPSSFPYCQLRAMSFRQLYSLVVVVARWNWALDQDRSLVLQRAEESDRMRQQQPAYAALLLRESGGGRSERPRNAEEWTQAFDEDYSLEVWR